MKKQRTFRSPFWLVALVACVRLVCIGTVEVDADVIVQQLDEHLVVEAELFEYDDLNDEFYGWIVIDTNEPVEVELHHSNPGYIEVPPPSSNASEGLAILDQAGGGGFTDQLGYALQFETPGTYYLYLRMSAFDLRQILDDNYGNEDSIYLPVESIDEDPTSEHLRASRDGFIDFDQMGVLPSAGCRDFEEPWVIPDDECDVDGLRGPIQMEGQYHWQPANWNNGLGHVNYEIEDTGVTLDFNLASRERGAALDVFVFSQRDDLTPRDLDAILAELKDPGDPYDFDGDGMLGGGDVDILHAAIVGGDRSIQFDVNSDGSVNAGDLKFFVEDGDTINSYLGDGNLDGQFNTSDLVGFFQGGKFEAGTPASFAQGDQNADGVFNTSDLVSMFQSGGFEKGPKPVVATVPEPGSLGLVILGAASLLASGRRRK